MRIVSWNDLNDGKTNLNTEIKEMMVVLKLQTNLLQGLAK